MNTVSTCLNTCQLSIKPSVSPPRERFWDIQVAKIDSLKQRSLCPNRPAPVPLRHTLVTSQLTTQHILKWLGAIFICLPCFSSGISRDGQTVQRDGFRKSTTFTSLSIATAVNCGNTPLQHKGIAIFLLFMTNIKPRAYKTNIPPRVRTII